MIYTFGDNQKTLKRARAFAPQLIAQAEALPAGPGGLEIKAEYADIFPTLYGWWRFTNRTAKLFLHSVDVGFTIEATPLMRNILEHTYSIIWLADVGVDGLLAIEDSAYQLRLKHIADLKRTGWKIATDVDAGPPPKVPVEGDATFDKHKKLVGEITNFNNLVTAFGTPDMYPVYRHLSDYTHSSVFTASGYLHRNEDGSVSLRDTAESNGNADIIWTTVSLIQAGTAISQLIAGDPLSNLLEKAVREMGIPPNFLPRRPAKK